MKSPHLGDESSSNADEEGSTPCRATRVGATGEIENDLDQARDEVWGGGGLTT